MPSPHTTSLTTSITTSYKICSRDAAGGANRAVTKLFIYGYLNRVPSSRALEQEAGRNVEVMWLAGRLVPEHKAIADFRREFEGSIP